MPTQREQLLDRVASKLRQLQMLRVAGFMSTKQPTYHKTLIRSLPEVGEKN